LLAIDIVPSATLPEMLYRGEVLPRLEAHPELRVLVCVGDAEYEENPQIKGVCRRLAAASSSKGRIGLKTVVPGVGLCTILRMDIDATGHVRRARAEEGWFPRPILDAAKGLNRLAFHGIIDEFVAKIQSAACDEKRALKLVRATIDKLLQHYPSCHPQLAHFMRLAHFEALLRRSSPDESEHVFHSFRVFLAGCSIVNQFHDRFQAAHERYCIGSRNDLSIEYCWLLTAIFHDIGRPQEGFQKLAAIELDDEDVTVSSSERRWTRESYASALAMLGSLGAFVASCPDQRTGWDGGVIPGDAIRGDMSKPMQAAWARIYDSFGPGSHAVVGALNLLAQLIEKAAAADETKNRPFVVTHAAPAALAILLHDWKLWEEAKQWKLVPVDSAILPLAAILIFLDTWDDYKRKGEKSMIQVDSYSVANALVEVAIRWISNEYFEKEKAQLKYQAFDSALKNLPCAFRIERSVSGAA